MLGFAPVGDLALGEIADDALVSTWFMPLSVPPRFKPGIRPAEQQFLAFNPLPRVSFAWFQPLSEPLHAKPGLAASRQQFLAAPAQLRPRPTTTGTLAALETKDTFLGSTRLWSRVTAAEIGVTATTAPAAQIGVAVPVAITSAKISIL